MEKTKLKWREREGQEQKRRDSSTSNFLNLFLLLDIWPLIKLWLGGIWVAQLVQRLILDFLLGHDLSGMRPNSLSGLESA